MMRPLAKREWHARTSSIFMETKLHRVLSKYSSTVKKAETTESVYYTFGCLTLRVSDHFSSSSDGDLAIFKTQIGYVVVPMVGTNKVIKTFTSVNNLFVWLASFEEMASMLIKSPQDKLPGGITPQRIDTSNVAAPTKWFGNLLGLTKENYEVLKAVGYPALRPSTEPLWRSIGLYLKAHSDKLADISDSKVACKTPTKRLNWIISHT